MRPGLMAGSLFLLSTGCTTGLRAVNTPEPDVEIDETGLEGTETGESSNLPPFADAGDDVLASVGDVVMLDGSESSDPDGDALIYSWYIVSKPSVSATILINDTETTPEFYVDAEGEYVIRLTVDDGRVSVDDDVLVAATNPNNAPTANAGNDQAVSVGDTVQLNGGSSSDPDGDSLNFRWRILSKPGSSSAILDDPTGPLPRFTADRAGAYEIELVVDDGEFQSSPDRIRVMAEASDDEDCLSCAAEAQRAMAYRWTAGTVASGPALVLLPILALLWHRRRHDD